ncbi:MAG: transglutaminase-like domain-containing protein [Eubacteriales bacterium]
MKYNTPQTWKRLTAAIALCALLTGCATAPVAAPAEETVVETTAMDDVVECVEMLDIDLGIVPLSATPAVSTVLMPVASGTTVYSNAKAYIDASHTADGYVMIKSLEITTADIKVVVTGPSGVAYYYSLAGDGSFEVFPLSDGNGNYLFQICKNATGTSYSVSYSTYIPVTLKDQFAPFLLPNQYVNYTADSQAVAQAATLTAGKTTEVEKIKAVYNYVVANLTYDNVRAATVTSGYLPDIDAVLTEKKGICFDYAALMTAMLRSQGVPCKLVVGNAGTAYHAWISVYTANQGWLDGVIYFDGVTWELMDPTFASGGVTSTTISSYINSGTYYTAKYLY